MEDKLNKYQKAFEYWRSYFDKDFKFISTNQIPDIPVLPDEFMKEVVIPGLIKFGAITKDELEIGKWYGGSCRNSSVARWNGESFDYIRYKWGFTYIDTTNHFQDDDGSDFFIPITKLPECEQKLYNDRITNLTN